MNQVEVDDYRWNDAVLNFSHTYLLPAFLGELDRLCGAMSDGQMRVFELGCGNGKRVCAVWLGCNRGRPVEKGLRRLHGYRKDLALAVSGKMDGYFTALWDNEHIKVPVDRVTRYIVARGSIRGHSLPAVDRIPMLAKSMIAIAKKAK